MYDNRIIELKKELSFMEQKLIDDKYIDITLYRAYIRELNSLRNLRDKNLKEKNETKDKQ